MTDEKEFLGMSIHTAALLGASLLSVNLRLIDFLENRLEKRIMLESLKEKISLKVGGSVVKKTSKINKSIERVKNQLESINQEIKDINENVLAEVGINKRLNLLDVSSVNQLVEERLKTCPQNNETVDLFNENTKMKILNSFSKVIDSINEIFEYLSSREDFGGLEKLQKSYAKNLKESIHIYSFGYSKTAVLCAGRTIEKVINDYIRKLFENNRISKEDFDEFINNEYSNKLGFLKDKFINEEEFTKLKAFSFDRNKGGHPDLGEITQEKARSLISNAIWLIIDLQEKIKKLDEIKSGENQNE